MIINLYFFEIEIRPASVKNKVISAYKHGIKNGLGGLIQGIRVYRDLTGASLKDAKEYVEKITGHRRES